MRAAEVFSQKHFPEVVQHEEFILLGQGEVEKLIKCDEIQVPPAWCHSLGRPRPRHGAAAVLLRQGFWSGVHIALGFQRAPLKLYAKSVCMFVGGRSLLPQ